MQFLTSCPYSQALDLSAWLTEHVTASDHVELVMDLESRQFELLEHLLTRGTLLLIDRLHVRWHIQHMVRSQTPLNCQLLLIP